MSDDSLDFGRELERIVEEFIENPVVQFGLAYLLVSKITNALMEVKLPLYDDQ